VYTVHRPEIPNKHTHGVVMKTQVAQNGRWSKLYAATHEVLVGAGDAVQAFDALDDGRHGVWQG
jgi:hypothetical protein